MQALQQARIPFRSHSGTLLGYIKLTATNEASNIALAPIIEITEIDASEHGETTMQLRESERYEYEVESLGGADLRLRCSLAKRRRSLGLIGSPDAGLIETRSFCGTLMLELVEGEVEYSKVAVGSALIDVRSLKLDYRTEYRGMVRRMADELATLAVDSRSATKASFVSNFEARSEPGWLQLQLELMREILESEEFAAALQRIVTYPHERLSTSLQSAPIDFPIKWTAQSIRQLSSGNPRRALPTLHPLRTSGLTSVPARINVAQHFKDLDTPENRFVKHVLLEFRGFASSAANIFDANKGWGASKALANRLQTVVDNWLGRAMFQEVGEMRFTPLGSSVLQRKAGYREVMRWWLRSRTAAELSWEGGEDMFRAGQRDVASLYEYWLFFELLGWFCKACCGGRRPPIEALIDGLNSSSPNLRLKKKVELGPFIGAVDGIHRSLSAKFSYNRRFGVAASRAATGSWTRALHPDYTFSFWPSEISEREAEALELLVHIHFDAKYRVEDIESLFGAESIDADEEYEDGNYKHQDLMKMHAYRDAIKRSQGAYVLYPGRSNSAARFTGFHEMLPGLGAFSISPDEAGRAQGLDALESFLESALHHLADRTTSQEKMSFHTHRSYASTNRRQLSTRARWPELSASDAKVRSLPVADHYVGVICLPSLEALEWCQQKSLVPVPLPASSGSVRIHPSFVSALHLAVSVPIESTSFHLWKKISEGMQIVTAVELAAMGYAHSTPETLYSLFEATPDADWASTTWGWRKVARCILAHHNAKGDASLPRPEAPYATSLLELLVELK